MLDRPLSTSDIEGVYAGLRPLLSGEARARTPHSRDEQTSTLSRKHAVVEPMLGLILVAGGKYTTYRVMAADVIDRAARRLGGATGDPGVAHRPICHCSARTVTIHCGPTGPIWPGGTVSPPACWSICWSGTAR